MSEQTLSDILHRASAAKKPVLLYFAAGVRSYSAVSRKLEKCMLSDVVVRAIADNYVFHVYRQTIGAGVEASTSLGVRTLNPTLIVLTFEGDVARRWVIESVNQVPALPQDFAASLAVWAGQAMPTSVEVFQAGELPNASLELLIEAAERAWGSGNVPQTAKWLSKITETGSAPSKKVAARASWLQLVIESSEKTRGVWQEAAKNYLNEFPAHGLPAIRMLAAAGATFDELDEHTATLLATAKASGVSLDLNTIAYEALALGATGGALQAAELQTKDFPEEPNSWDTLAHVQAARGEYAAAVETALHGLEVATESDPIRCVLQQTLGDAQNRSPGEVRPICQRKLSRNFTAIPGEDPLFVDPWPSAVVRQALQEPLREVVQEHASLLPEVVALSIHFGSTGEDLSLAALSPGISPDTVQMLADKVAAFHPPLPLPDLDMVFTFKTLN